MGIYINPPITIFNKLATSDHFVDKSKIIELTNSVLSSDKKYICISRPRRFGKTLTAKMLCAYYEQGVDNSNIFNNLKIAKSRSYLEDLNKYHVIFVNMTDEFNSSHRNVDVMLKKLNQRLINELTALYKNIEILELEDLSYTLKTINAHTGDSFIVIIDEWDCILREASEDFNGIKEYLEWLKLLLKDKDYISLAYMTGIFPVKKYGTQSALNMFDEYSMTAPELYAPFIGFTASEVQELCNIHQMNYDEMQRWYDGYSFEHEAHVYNPNSVITAVLNKRFANYWTRTETFKTLQQYINLNFDGLKENIVKLIAGNYVVVTFANFQNDLSSFTSKDDVLTLLIHLGYLALVQDPYTIIDTASQCVVKIPNHEIRSEFVNSLSENKLYAGVYDLINQTNELLQNIWAQNNQKVAELFDKAHSKHTSILKYNDENSLSCVITLSLLLSNGIYSVKREMPAGLGFADMVYLPRNGINKPALLIELKYNASAQSAITQIKNKQYGNFFEGYQGKVLLIGINYDKHSKKHSCVIEELVI